MALNDINYATATVYAMRQNRCALDFLANHTLQCWLDDKRLTQRASTSTLDYLSAL